MISLIGKKYNTYNSYYTYKKSILPQQEQYA